MGWTVTTRSGSGGIVGKIMMTGFGLFFAFIGSQFVKQEWQSLQEAKAMQRWTQTTCTIETCTVEDAGEDFRLVLSYRYTVNGRSYTSDQYGKQQHFTAESIAEIKAVEKKLHPGKTVDGYHNPSDPSQAVLDLPTIGSAKSSLGMSMIFPAFGILFATIPWLRKKRKIKSHSKEASPKIFLFIFGSFFALFGSLMLKPFLIEPLQKTQSATNWEAVPAVVVSSKVKSHSSDDGTTYSPYIAYRYEINGQEYFGDQYSFMSGSSCGYESKSTIVRQYPKGFRFQVYVNPIRPAESVIHPEATTSLLFGLIPLLFTLIGVGIIIGGFRVGKGTRAKLDKRQAAEHVVILKGSSPIARAIFISLFTIIWNGVVYLIYRSDAGIFFLSIFGFFGIVTLIAAVKNILAIFNPRASVELTPGNIHPGTKAALRWRLNGRIDRITELTITLKCLKVTTVTSGHGKDRSTRTIKTPLYECPLLQTDSQLEIAQGALEFLPPADRPASRPGSHNGFQWQLVFHGTIDRWPNMNDEFPFLVYPN